MDNYPERAKEGFPLNFLQSGRDEKVKYLSLTIDFVTLYT